MMQRDDNIPLVLPYLKNVQKNNIKDVNEAINECYVEEEQYQELRKSIDAHDNYDHIGLAQKIEKHELLEFRRIAAYIYKCEKRWQQSVALSKADGMYKDAIDTVAESGDSKLGSELLKFFVEKEDKECFAAALYTCYDMIDPSVALELAWRNNIIDFVMPFMIQYLSDTHSTIKELMARTEPKKEDEVFGEDPMANPLGGGGMRAIGSTAFNPPQNFGGMPPQQNFGGMPPQQGFGGMQPQQNFGGMPPQQGFGGMQPQQNFNNGFNNNNF